MMLLAKLRNNGTVDVCIILDAQSIERIQRYDPAEVLWQDLPVEYRMRRPATIGVAFATAEDQQEIERLSVSGDPHWKEKAFKLVTRGFEYRTDLGDHDFGPTVLGKPTEGKKQ